MFGGIKHTLCAVLLVGLSLTAVSGQEVQSNHPIRLVVGKQPGSRKDMVHRAAPTSRPPGFLDRLMSFGRNAGDDDQAAVTPLPDSQREPADWTGVPYHEPGHRSTSAARSSQSAPIVDPGSARRRPATTRSGSSLGPVPTPPTAPQAPRVPSPPRVDSLHVPTAKSQVIEVGNEPDEFSATFSSRRNSRREIDPLDAELMSPSDFKSAAGEKEIVANQPIDLSDVPHVQQRQLAKPAAAPQASASVATATPKPTQAKPQAKPQTLSAPARPSMPPSLASDRPAAAASAKPTTTAAPALQAPPAHERVAARPSPGYPLSLDAGGVPAHKPLSAPAAPQASAPQTSASQPGASQPVKPQAAAPQAMVLNTDVDSKAVGSGIAMPAPTHSPKAPQAQATADVAGPSGVRVQAEGRIQLHSTDGSQPPTEVVTDAQMQARDPLAAAGQISSVPAEVPGLRVIAEGPSQIMIRQITQYEIRVENRGAVAAPGVLVRTAIPEWIGVRGNNATRGEVDLEQDGGARQLLWKIDALPAGAVERLTLQVQAQKSGTFGVAVDWTLLPQKNNLMVNVREPKLQLLIEGPDQVVFGESQSYKVRVLNPGDGTAPNVMFTLSPNSATPQTQKIGAIPPGKEAHFEVELTAQDLGDLQIHGLATADLELRTEGSKTIRVAAAQLEAILTGPPLRYQNGEATYKLKVQNNGVATCRNVVAKLQLPVGVEYVDGMQGAELNGNTLRWTIDQLETGASRDYEFRCNMSNTGAHLLAFECQGTAAGRAAVSLTTRVEALADLVLTINDPPAPAPIGEDVVYELVIANRGSKAANDVRALTHFSDHIEPARLEGHTGKITVGQVLLDPIPRIDPGQSVTIRIIARAMEAGHHRFRAEITCGETILVAEEATRYMSPMNEQISRRSSEATNW